MLTWHSIAGCVAMAKSKWRCYRGCKTPLLIVILLTILLFTISTFIGFSHHEPHVEITLETFNLLGNKDDFFHHVEDMQRLRKSVIMELGQLEEKRNRLKSSVDSLDKKAEDTENELKGMQRDLAQVKSDIRNMIVTREETLKDYSAISLPLKLLPNVSEPSYTNPTKQCALDSCFDYSRCSVVSNFPIYLYPLSTEDHVLLSWISAIFKSPYVTHNPDIACIYLFLYDGNNFDAQTLKYWRGDGRNHVIINVVSTDVVVSKSRAMQAQIEFDNYKPIHNFDITLPYMNLQPLDHNYLPLLLPVRKSNLLSFYGRVPIEAADTEKDFISAFSKLHNPGLSVIVNISCVADSSCSKHRWCLCSRNELVKIERNSTFIVVPNCAKMSNEQFSYRIHSALVNGAIPIILGDYYDLPMAESIPWAKAVVLLPSQRVTEAVYIVRNILEPDLITYKKHGRYILENYLISIPKIANVLIDLLRARINIPPISAPTPDATLIYDENNPMPVFETQVELNEILGPLEDRFPSPSYQRNFTSWQSTLMDMSWSMTTYLYPHTPWDPILPTDAKYHGSPYGFRPINGGAGGSGKEFSEALGGNHPREQFTIVILTYDRADLLQQQLAQFHGLPYLNKVLIIWNNPNYPSPTLQWPRIHVPIQVIKTATNSLNNRFLPYKEIETEAILSMDDDMYLRHDEIIFAFRVWRENRDRIVGFPGRYHAWNARDHQWNYNSNHSCELSLVLTGAAFFHKYYMYQYSYFMPQAIRDRVDDYMNCEDIAMNFLVSHITGKPPVKTTSRWTFRCPTCGEATLWTDESHFNERHQCIQYFIQVYGYLPLLYTQLRTDSVLFKTRVPQDKTKCFSLV